MRATGNLCIPIVLCAIAGAPSVSWAQQTTSQNAAAAQALQQEIRQLRADFEQRMTALEARLSALTGATGAPAPAAGTLPVQTAPTVEVPPGAQGAGGPSGTLPVYGGASAGSKIFNPDIAAIGNFLGATGRNDVNPRPALELPETELTLQAIVDPYARADFFVAIGDEGAEIEEGFLTFPTLPGGVLMKVGKMRASFGKINPLHTHLIPWIDRPLMTNNLVGGEEGLGDAGISVARLIPNPWIFLEATGQVFRGNAGDLFQSSQRGDVSFVGRVRGYQDITESTNVDLGASYARGHNASGFVEGADLGRFETQLLGADATIRWRPLQRSIYRSFVARAEGVLSRREQPEGRQDAKGFFVSGDYQFGRRWFAGVRYDRSERAESPSDRDTGQSLILTYWPSEFSQVRGQFRRTNYAEGLTGNEFLFQFQFSIGAHGAHTF